MERDLEQEQLLGDIILAGGDPLLFLNDTDGQEGEDDGSGDQQWRRKEIMTAPVTEWRRKEIMMTAPVTERRREP
jgi:hypothetical protein